MLNNIRKFSKTFFAKLLLIIIIIPFVFWGMGDVFNSGNSNNVVKINNYSISTQDFINHLNQSKIDTNVIRKNINNGILEELLSALISKTLLEMEIEDLGISISEKTLIKKIKINENFLDENKKFSRSKYERFLLSNSIDAPSFEKRLRENELKKKLFAYISGGIKSPDFIIDNIFNQQTQKIKLEYINLEKNYKSKNEFTELEIKKFIEENKDELKEEYLDFSYIKISPENLTGTNDFNDLFFQNIDEIDNKISNGISFDKIIKELKIKPIIKKNYITKINNDEFEEEIYKKRNDSKTQLIDKNNFYLLFNIDKIEKILPSLKDKNFLKKITNALYENEKYNFNRNLIEEINTKKFNQTKYQKLAEDSSSEIQNTILKSIKDNNKFEKNSIKLLYSLPINSFSLINDKNNNIYIAQIIDIEEQKINKKSKDYNNYINQANMNLRDGLYSSYDIFLSKKYKINVNQNTLERVKNYFN